METVECHICYGPPVTRDALQDCDLIFRGERCSREDMLTQNLDPGERFFGSKPSFNMEEAFKDLQDSLKALMTKQEEMDKAQQKKDAEMEAQKKAFEEMTQAQQKKDEEMEALVKTVGWLKQKNESSEKAEGLEELKEYLELEISPRLICWSVISDLKGVVQPEFKASAKFFSSRPEFKTATIHLQEFVKDYKNLENWNFAELCHKYVKNLDAGVAPGAAAIEMAKQKKLERERKQQLQVENEQKQGVSETKQVPENRVEEKVFEMAEEDDPAAAAARVKELMNLIFSTAMATVATSIQITPEDWIREWSAFYQLAMERHTEGHPHVINKYFPLEQEIARVSRVIALYKKLIDGKGRSVFSAFGLAGFRNLGRIAEPVASPPTYLTPSAVWFGGQFDILQQVFGSKFQDKKRSYVSSHDLWSSEAAIFYLSNDWKADAWLCLARGVRMIAVYKDNVELELLRGLSSQNKGRITYLQASDDAEFAEELKKTLAGLHMFRSSKREKLLMAVRSFEEESESSSSSRQVVVLGRVERGEVLPGMQLVFEGGGMSLAELQANSFLVADVDVKQDDARAEVGAEIRLTLIGPRDKPALKPGMILCDFREAVSSRTEFKAVVLSIGEGMFVTGEYELQTSSGHLYKVRVQILSKLNRTGGSQESVSLPSGSTMFREEASALKHRECGEAIISSSSAMPVLPALKQVQGSSQGNYGLSRFQILTGTVALLAGQAWG